MFWTSKAYAMAAQQTQGADGPMGFLQGPIVPMLLMFVVFYFLLIRPQQKKAKEHKAMLAALKAGDKVITAGGLYGRIVKIEEDKAVIDLGDSKVTVARGYITGLSAGGAPAAPEVSK